MKGTGAKCHNRKHATNAKLEIRLNVLEYVKPAHVLDCFCGPVGEMYSGAWVRAETYLGIDEEWRIADSRRRMVCDNKLALRCLDLSRFNVFDLDAFGQPWEQCIILAHRRKWAPRERGAIVLTDGSGMKARFGVTWGAMTQLTGISGMIAPTEESSDRIHELCVSAMLDLMGVQQIKRWTALSKRGSKGSTAMRYTSIVFEGRQTVSKD